MKATKDHLLKATVTGEPATLTVDGLDFDIRPLSRKEAVSVHECAAADGIAASEALLLSFGMLDPAMTVDEVDEWQSSRDPGAAGKIQALSVAIGKISGMQDDSGKGATKSPRRRR